MSLGMHTESEPASRTAVSTRTYARVAGFTLLLYIGVGIAQMALFGGTTAGEDTNERLASMAARAADVRSNVVLGLLTCFVALVLGVALYVMTRDQDPGLAMLALACRVGEGIIGAVLVPLTLGLLSFATEKGANTPDVGTNAVGFVLLSARAWNPIISALFFAVGSTLYSWLLLRGRMIPTALAWLGVSASVLLVVVLPLQIVDVISSPFTELIWLPMAAFEVPLGLWLIIKGVATPTARNVTLTPANSRAS